MFPRPIGESIVFKGRKDLDQIFSQAEISARLHYAVWPHQIIDNHQVRINADGTVELSGNLQMDRIQNLIDQQVGELDWNEVDYLNYLQLIKANPPIYIKALPILNNNTLVMDVQELQVGRFTIDSQQHRVGELLAKVGNQLIDRVDGLDINNVIFSEGQMKFTGSVPAEMTVYTRE